MSEKIIKNIVYFLSVLIIIALFAVVYGMYIRISHKSSKNNVPDDISLLLNKDQEIINMQVIDQNRILVTIENNNQIHGIIYDINKKKIIQSLNK